MKNTDKNESIFLSKSVKPIYNFFNAFLKAMKCLGNISFYTTLSHKRRFLMHACFVVCAALRMQLTILQ